MKLGNCLAAEFVGTFWLVLGGCGSAVLAAAFPDVGIGLLGVSFAFGLGVPLAHAKADFVILGEQLVSVVQALRLSRRTLRIVRQNLWWALVYNAACVPLAIAGLLPAWLAGLGMASSSLLVVLNAMRLARLAHAEKIK